MPDALMIALPVLFDRASGRFLAWLADVEGWDFIHRFISTTLNVITHTQGLLSSDSRPLMDSHNEK